MEEKSIIDNEQKKILYNKIIMKIKNAVKYAEEGPYPNAEDVLSDVMSARRIDI